ncbi:CRISPR system Cascade subunit CasB [Allocatelliglobosispora scoriae]|uniref:CRISPR system Cascade subunit CasB n=1 Tax=Allocatelliglobosispora scoriae TaxID=643052 RepID=A0A841C3J2_9ACTN|nr:type I-E CRISPR-associated protein Cse2/CasB [Allocatelliglobosispora scoriae]MBB5874338.1 CRISPR system Cascade subunit CasB [Allocatelliglobosispora scoriae]
MTTAVAEEKPSAEDGRRRYSRRRGPLGDDVAKTVFALQNNFLRERQEAIGALARLRRGIGREPGFDYTLDGYLAVPDDLLGDWLPDDGAASDAEHAKHAAVTLYALHQQSRRERMHVDQRGLGTAIAELSRVVGSTDGVRRRFSTLGTAATFGEALYHLRSLVVMLREHRIALDYGLLADDLRTMRRPGGRAQVQAVWGREFFRSKPTRSADETTETESTEENQP